MAKHKHHESLVWGVILIVLGGIFLLESFDIEIWHYIWRLWPLILVVWGADKLYNGLKEHRAGKDEEVKPVQPPQDKSNEG